MIIHSSVLLESVGKTNLWGKVSILPGAPQHKHPETMGPDRLENLRIKEGSRNDRTTKMLYLGLILDISINKCITQQMAVRKNRKYNKAHGNHPDLSAYLRALSVPKDVSDTL